MSVMTVEPMDLGAHAGPWSEEEWLALPQEGTRIELLDGSLLVSPNPAPPHQRVSRRLANMLDEPTERLGGEVLEAVNIRLRSGRVLIPDVSVLRDCVDHPIIDAALVRIASEIVSPDQASRDRVLKYDLYARSGIPWYLIVEASEEHIEASLHQLTDGLYTEVAKAGAGERLHVEPLEFDFDPADLVSPSRPDHR